jgi:hypothetical protein
MGSGGEIAMWWLAMIAMILACAAELRAVRLARDPG